MLTSFFFYFPLDYSIVGPSESDCLRGGQWVFLLTGMQEAACEMSLTAFYVQVGPFPPREALWKSQSIRSVLA